MICTRYQRLTTSEKDLVPHRFGIGCDNHRAAIGLHCAPPDMNDHRLARDIGQRLIGESCRFQPCWDDDQTVHGGLR
jgi:hypothetical protein